MADALLLFRTAIRRLVKEPGFALPIIIALAIGIGATTSVFSIFSAMFLNANGFKDSDRIVTLWASDPAHGQSHVETSYGDWLAWQASKDTVRDAALISSVNLDFTLSAGGDPFMADGTTVSGSFFGITGTRAFAGRLLNDSDDQPNIPVRAVLSHSLWRSRFGSDLSIIGRTIRSGNDSLTVVGIAPPEFDFPRDVSVWIPLRASWPTVAASQDLRVFRGLARLQDGVSVEQAAAQLNVAARRMQQSQPSATRFSIMVTPLQDEIFGSAKTAVRVLLGAVLLVLLIACASAANLLLANANARGGEIAVRIALGAGRARVVRLLLAEAACLGVAAGFAGMSLAVLGTGMAARLAPQDIPGIAAATVDVRIMMFGLILTCATVLLFGLAPAVIASKRDPNDALKRSGQRLSGNKTQVSLRRILIVSEVAFAAFLLIGAGLLVRSYSRLAAVDPGFRAERVLTFRVTTERADQQSRRLLYTRILEGLRQLPGAESAAAVLIRPLSGTVGWDTSYAAEEQAEVDAKRNPNGNYEAISPGYFRTMGIRLVAGRDFADVDKAGSLPVVIINESTARRHWPRGGAVGKRLRLGGGPRAQWVTVAGVVSDVRYREWEASRPDFYVPLLQRAQHRTDFVVKTHIPPMQLAEAARRVVLAADSTQAISNLTTMEELADRAIARSRFNGAMLGALAGCALFLAAFGIYSVLSYMVTQSAFEIAVRGAMGAVPGQVARMVAGRGIALVALGASIGFGSAALANGVIAALLYEVSPVDPVAYGAAAGILMVIAAVASAWPALRAARIDPMVTLRSGG